MATDFSQINVRTLGSQPLTNVFTGKQENMPSTKSLATQKTSNSLFGGNFKPITANQSTVNALKGTSVGNATYSDADVLALQLGTYKPKVDTSPTPVSSLMTPKPTVAPVTTQTAQNQLGVTANNAIAQAQANQKAQATVQPVSGREKALEDILQLSQKQGEKGQRNLDLQTETGLTKKQEELNKINAEAITLSAAYDKQIEALRKNPEGKLTAQLNNEINQLSRLKNSELADIATRQAVAQGNVELANKIIAQKLDAEFEPIQNQIDSLKTYYSLAGDDLTSSEKVKLQEQINDRQREKDYQYDLKLMNAKKALDSQYPTDGLRQLSPEDNARLNATPQAKSIQDATKYADALKAYKQAIADYGTGELFGKGAGTLGQTYSALIGATKDYYTLGSYDNGVQKLIELGIKEPSVFGLKSSRVGALDTALASANATIQRNAEQLLNSNYGNSVEVKSLLESAGISTDAPDPLEFGVNADPLKLGL